MTGRQHNMSVILLSTAGWVFAFYPPPAAQAQPKPALPKIDPADKNRIKTALREAAYQNPDSLENGPAKRLAAMGDTVFPVYAEILASPDSKPEDRYTVFFALSETKADRRRFLPDIIKGLEPGPNGATYLCLLVLRDIGTERDTSPVVALLSDEDDSTKIYAAETLALIGGDRDLVAFDIWLRPRSYDKVTRQVKKFRQQLEERLNAAKAKDKPKK